MAERVPTSEECERIRAALSYDKDFGRLVWQRTISSHGIAGTEAGTVTKRGYRVIQIDGAIFTAARLAWFLGSAKWPEGVIAFRDGDPKNLAYSNLIDATKSARMQRQITAHKGNKSNLIGASFHKKSGKWAAQLVKKGMRKRHFGLFETAEEAHIEYLRQKAIHHNL